MFHHTGSCSQYGQQNDAHGRIRGSKSPPQRRRRRRGAGDGRRQAADAAAHGRTGEAAGQVHGYVAEGSLSGRAQREASHNQATPCVSVRHLLAYRREMEKAPNFERPWNASARAPAVGCKGARFAVGAAPSLNFRHAF